MKLTSLKTGKTPDCPKTLQELYAVMEFPCLSSSDINTVSGKDS